MEGILLVDKPIGWTSFDVVNKIRSLVAKDAGIKPRNLKVGHTGTLDPAATGLLVVCIGKKYTKMITDFKDHQKSYQADIYLGAKSSTGDSEGEIVKDKETKEFTEDQIISVLKSFRGKQEQIPPAYSAIKIDGKRAYELARKGEKVTIKSRKIEIFSIELIEYKWPKARIKCRVSSGTYIRTLAEDIGKRLGVSAYLSALRRTSIDKWGIEEAIQIKGVDVDIIEEKLLV